METFTHAEGTGDEEVDEKTKTVSETDVESGLEAKVGLGGFGVWKYPPLLFFWRHNPWMDAICTGYMFLPKLLAICSMLPFIIL